VQEEILVVVAREVQQIQMKPLRKSKKKEQAMTRVQKRLKKPEACKRL
jgi:hypothetical protein